MVEFVGNWGERPESAVARWRNDVTALRFLYFYGFLLARYFACMLFLLTK